MPETWKKIVLIFRKGSHNWAQLQAERVVGFHASTSKSTIIDTHTHLLSTFALYRSKYPEGQYEIAFDFVEGVYTGKGVETKVDVWCEPEGTWKELADGKWEGIQYLFVIGAHEAKSYTPTVKSEILTALSHPSCVGLEVQQRVFAQQLRIAVDRAEEDTERIMKEIVPKDHWVHIHSFTDTAFGLRLLDYFPNLHIGVTGVVYYAMNLNTAELLKQMLASDNKRILLETDAPCMVPANVYDALEPKQSRLPFSHSLIIPWTAEFRALDVGREGAKKVYGV
ncbi:hypothetical protein EDD85DRAFT_920113 [Armillaria nabsnona]|nr:hypothetical protein EDD85DRAFT_920113 [Armillaria nabsnona]